MTAPVGSTAVVPFYRVRRGKLRRGLVLWDPLQGQDTYACRTCGWQQVYCKDISREVRMIALARHLKDAHGTGPLARVTVP